MALSKLQISQLRNIYKKLGSGVSSPVTQEQLSLVIEALFTINHVVTALLKSKPEE